MTVSVIVVVDIQVVRVMGWIINSTGVGKHVKSVCKCINYTFFSDLLADFWHFGELCFAYLIP